MRLALALATTALAFIAGVCEAQQAPTNLVLGRDKNGSVMAGSYPPCDALITVAIPTAGQVVQITPLAGTTDIVFQQPQSGTTTYARPNATTFPGFTTATSLGWEKNPGQRNITWPYEGGRIVFYGVTSDTSGAMVSYCNYTTK